MDRANTRKLVVESMAGGHAGEGGIVADGGRKRRRVPIRSLPIFTIAARRRKLLGSTTASLGVKPDGAWTN